MKNLTGKRLCGKWHLTKKAFVTSAVLAYGLLLGSAQAQTYPFWGTWQQTCTPVSSTMHMVKTLQINETPDLKLTATDTYYPSNDCSGSPMASLKVFAHIEKIHPYQPAGDSSTNPITAYALKLTKHSATFQSFVPHLRAYLSVRILLQTLPIQWLFKPMKNTTSKIFLIFIKLVVAF